MYSSEYHEHTLAGPAICAGVGIHTGARVRLSIRPSASGTGIVFVRSDVHDRDNRIPATAASVTQTTLGTVITNAEGVSVSTIEHIMAALAALGIDNAVIELDGPEVPIMDGSAQPFVQLLDRAGFRRQDLPQQVIEVLEPVIVTEGDKSAALYPCDRFEVRFEIVYDSKAVGHQIVDLEITEDSFRQELASARTFGFVHEVEALRARGLARGGSLENAVVIDGDDVMNPEGLRYDNECVRHKALDAVGDLYVLGMPLKARFVGIKAGHSLNNALVRALLERPEAYRLVTRAPALAAVG